MKTARDCVNSVIISGVCESIFTELNDAGLDALVERLMKNGHPAETAMRSLMQRVEPEELEKVLSVHKRHFVNKILWMVMADAKQNQGNP